jgi:hypothetical protein
MLNFEFGKSLKNVIFTIFDLFFKEEKQTKQLIFILSYSPVSALNKKYKGTIGEYRRFFFFIIKL